MNDQIGAHGDSEWRERELERIRAGEVAAMGAAPTTEGVAPVKESSAPARADEALRVLRESIPEMTWTQVREAVEVLATELTRHPESLDESAKRTIETQALSLERAEARVTELERAHDRLVRHHHKAQSHPRDFEVCTWPECRRARAVLGSVPHHEHPDPSSHGGHPYTPTERALGYGSENDPRFQSVPHHEGSDAAYRVKDADVDLEAVRELAWSLQYDNIHFHERAMADPFEAESYVLGVSRDLIKLVGLPATVTVHTLEPWED